MTTNPTSKYQRFTPVKLTDRTWPDNEIHQAPLWCAVDLRDGNQALRVPMTVEQKIDYFKLLVKIGFKEIEVGFPAASNTEFEFIRRLIEENLIPHDVTIQVLTQARNDLIDKTIESLKDVKRVIIHLYNSTSPAQRKHVFALEKEGIMKLALDGIKHIQSRVAELVGTDVTLQYSPESFSATEVDFAVEICNAVISLWKPTPEKKMIINLPATVEINMPNVYADQIEWFCRKVASRDSLIISVHTHNDRGTGVAATEMALLAGADRVEGTLFGNGERTGNLDVVIVALNLYSHGIHPQLDFSDMFSIRTIYERCTGMTIHERQPYSGELVFTAFSGSHQDAIKKGFNAWQEREMTVWEVPYVPIDPEDIGRSFHMETIRVNGQSGKGGMTFLLERDFGIILPKGLEKEFSAIANPQVDALQSEVTGRELKEMLWHEYVEQKSPLALVHYTDMKNGSIHCNAIVSINDTQKEIEGKGNGPIDAFVNALIVNKITPVFKIVSYVEHAIGTGADASAISYVQVAFENAKAFGIGVHTNSELAPLYAIISAINRANSAKAFS